MPKASPIQSSFSSGEFGARLEGRSDLPRYRQALKFCKNYIPTLQGDLFNRPGSAFTSETKASTSKSRLIRFEFSTEQAYAIEMGDGYLRFYRDNGQIQSGGSPYEITCPFAEADIFQVRYIQSADVLYFVHPDYDPQVLSRLSDTNWTLNTLTFIDGPYLDLNTAATTLTASALVSSITVTASATTGINNDAGFDSSRDVNRLIRFEDSSGNAGYCRITNVLSATQVEAVVLQGLPSNATSGTGFWRLGLYRIDNFPSVVNFHEDRLLFGGAPDAPQRIDLSRTGQYTTFSPTEFDGTGATATNSISATLNANDVNAIEWALSDEKGLIVGTVGGEWIVRPSSNVEALTPANITAKRSTTYGSANIQPVQVVKAGIFVQRAGRKIRELSYYFDVDGFRAEDLTVLNQEITGEGVVEIAVQKEPQPIVWVVRSDGVLTGVTYERTTQNFNAAWHRHILGGVSDAGGTATKVESAIVIPTSDGNAEELWLIVQRYVNGAVKRYVEYLKQPFDEFTEQRDAFFVDSGLTYDAPLAISNVTKADPAVVTSTAHGLSNGDKVLIGSVLGMDGLNTNSYLVANVTANTFELQDLDGNNVDSSTFTTYVSGGEARKFVTTISGLSHLEGEQVTILGDGAVQPNRTVAGGSITLQQEATTVHVGLGYNSDGQLLRFNAGSADGTSFGKTRRTHRVGFMLNRSLGLQIGTSFTDLTNITFRTAADKLSRAPGLFTGIISETLEADYDFENEICFRQSQPLPSRVLAIMPQMHTQDR